MKALCAFAVFAYSTPLAPASLSSAPVYVHVTDELLKRAGTFLYKPGEATVLYCIAQPPRTTIACVVKTPTDMLVLIEATATEQQT